MCNVFLQCICTFIQTKLQSTCLKHTCYQVYSSRYKLKLWFLCHLPSSTSSSKWARNGFNWFYLGMWKGGVFETQMSFLCRDVIIMFPVLNVTLSFPPASAVEGIKSVLLCIWVAKTFIRDDLWGINPSSIRAQSMKQFNPRPKRVEKGIKISIWIVPKSVRFNQNLPYHRLFLFKHI